METTKTVKYDVWSLDVWGNTDEGYSINDRSCFSRDVEFPTTHNIYNEGTKQEFSDDWPTNKQIIDTLKEIGFLSDDADVSNIDIDGNYEYSLYLEDSTDGYPICQLEISC